MNPICPSCGSPARSLPESEWPAAGPVPEGTIGVFLCDGNHRIIVAAAAVQA